VNVVENENLALQTGPPPHTDHHLATLIPTLYINYFHLLSGDNICIMIWFEHQSASH